MLEVTSLQEVDDYFRFRVYVYFQVLPRLERPLFMLPVIPRPIID